MDFGRDVTDLTIDRCPHVTITRVTSCLSRDLGLQSDHSRRGRVFG